MHTLLRRVLLAIIALSLGVVVGGQLGLFASNRPSGIGVHDGRLMPSPPTPNSVNSQSKEGYSAIAPITYPGDGKEALARLRLIVAELPAAKVIISRPDYIYAEFTSRWLGFVDDVEFHLDERAHVIQVRSASRLGRKDFGVNRERIETIRSSFMQATAPG